MIYIVIGEAGKTLVRVIWNAIAADPFLFGLINSESLLSLESPAEHIENNDSALLSVYRYRIGEDPFMKNRLPVEGTGGMLRRPPLSLDLYYLITPMLADAFDRHVVLGKVMQVLYDQPTLDGPDLVGSLAAEGDTLRVIFNPVPLNDVALVWQALEIPYMLCISYMMRVALLQSTEQAGTARVVSVNRGYGSKAPVLAGGVT
ncbi:MAG: DUF4255 domain-containing protein [Pseudomonadota bacterium]|nr:DUF4255 domain-containing protein [Pseudomonadota bacterium]